MAASEQLIGDFMKIQKISWLSEAASEAEVDVTDGHLVCRAFSQPFDGRVGDSISDPLHLFGVRGAMRSDLSEVGFTKLSEEGLSYKVVATMVDPIAQLLMVGGIHLVADEDLPGGLKSGDLVELECARIDLW